MISRGFTFILAQPGNLNIKVSSGIDRNTNTQ